MKSPAALGGAFLSEEREGSAVQNQEQKADLSGLSDLSGEQ